MHCHRIVSMLRRYYNGGGVLTQVTGPSLSSFNVVAVLLILITRVNCRAVGKDQTEYCRTSPDPFTFDGACNRYDNIDVPACPPGKFADISCIQSDPAKFDCFTCPQYTFQPYNNNCLNCTPCTKCGSGQVEGRKCTDSQDTLCVSPPSSTTTEHPSHTVPGKTHGHELQSTRSPDVTVTVSPTPTVSHSDPTSKVLIGIVVFLLVVLLVLLLKYIHNKYKKRQKRRHGNANTLQEQKQPFHRDVGHESEDDAPHESTGAAVEATPSGGQSIDRPFATTSVNMRFLQRLTHKISYSDIKGLCRELCLEEHIIDDIDAHIPLKSRSIELLKEVLKREGDALTQGKVINHLTVIGHKHVAVQLVEEFNIQL